MQLLAHTIGLAEPGEHFGIEILVRTDAEMVNVVAGREPFNFGETRIFEATSQDYMANEAIAAKGDGGEAHADLKGDAGLFRQNADGTAALDVLYETAKQCDGHKSLAREMFPKGVA
jgi:hypothetical protein